MILDQEQRAGGGRVSLPGAAVLQSALAERPLLSLSMRDAFRHGCLRGLSGAQSLLLLPALAAHPPYIIIILYDLISSRLITHSGL